MLVSLGYKEIEVSIPSSSDTEFDFTRQLVSTPEAVPDDVWLQVLCPSRLDLIRQTVNSLKGAKKAILSLYIASSDMFLNTVLGMTQQSAYERIVEAIQYAKAITKDDPSQSRTTWNLMFSPETFSDTDLSYSLRLCEAAKSIWEPTAEVPIILNLPATVEMSTPNVYADQVEIFSRSISEREKVCVSLHPHNDRGCAIAAAELGQMAGAQRVEGCLFGNGERAGNVDLVILALNLYSQGIDPHVDFSDLPAIRAIVEDCTNVKVHSRAPYAGDLVFTAYSGAHQDAINKGLSRFNDLPDNGRQKLWKVPYLAIDPHDLGSSYEAVIRLNSQSGKGGVAWTLSRELHLQLPKSLQVQFSKVVKKASETAGSDISPIDITRLFFKRYFVSDPDPRILVVNIGQLDEPFADEPLCKDNSDHTLNGNGLKVDKITEDRISVSRTVDLVIKVRDKEQRLKDEGTDILDALQRAMAATSVGNVTFYRYECTMSGESGLESTLLVIECRSESAIRSTWGARILDDSDTAEVLAALSSALVGLLTC